MRCRTVIWNVAGGAGVPGLDAAGVGGRSESVADSAGYGIIAADGETLSGALS